MGGVMECLADLLALTRAAVDGIAVDDPQPCDEPATYQVVVSLVEGLEVTTDVCTAHQQLIEMALPGTRSLRKWSRAA
jgi:hypothetical protein